ncbi:hypothetical protein ACFQ6N_35470 [Kitasatospora sp. NPDC056446]|uniref:hypothetical protein n=1 Tax=Kitasatospora sp. NPDC056446 TaxID=3345819 RepID=UPI0036BD63D4
MEPVRLVLREVFGAAVFREPDRLAVPALVGQEYQGRLEEVAVVEVVERVLRRLDPLVEPALADEQFHQHVLAPTRMPGRDGTAQDGP